MNIRAFLLAAALLLLPAVSAAQDRAGVTGSGFYASLTGAWVVPRDSNVTRIDGRSGDAEFDSGFGVLGAVGRGFGNGFGAEIEIGYRNAEPKDEDSVDVGTLSFMANGVYSFGVGQVRPYFGAGVGAAQHSLTYTEGGRDLSLSDWTFAYQAMAGIAYPISDKTEFRAGYRYFATGTADFILLEADYAAHNFEAGILFRF